jgi:hypothetical protein
MGRNEVAIWPDWKMMPIQWPLLAGLCHFYGSLAISIILKQGEAVTKRSTDATFPLELVLRSQPQRQRSADMPTEEDLDHLIDQHVSGENQLSPSDDEIAALLAAAKRLVQLQEIDIPPEFAHRMELSIRACAHPHKLP